MVLQTHNSHMIDVQVWTHNSFCGKFSWNNINWLFAGWALEGEVCFVVSKIFLLEGGSQGRPGLNFGRRKLSIPLKQCSKHPPMVSNLQCCGYEQTLLLSRQAEGIDLYTWLQTSALDTLAARICRPDLRWSPRVTLKIQYGSISGSAIRIWSCLIDRSYIAHTHQCHIFCDCLDF